MFWTALFDIISDKFNLDKRYWETTKTKQATHFSDTIVISYETKELDSVIGAIVDIQHCIVELAKLGVLVRGAITEGDLIHNKNLLFGPALVEAYELEKRVSKYPRIILKSDVVDNFDKSKVSAKLVSTVEFNLSDLILKDMDGNYFVDYFFNVGYLKIIQTNSQTVKVNSFSQYYDYLRSLEKLIKSNINSKDSSIREKYGWMKENYNSRLNTFSDAKVSKIIKEVVGPEQWRNIKKLIKID